MAWKHYNIYEEIMDNNLVDVLKGLGIEANITETNSQAVKEPEPIKEAEVVKEPEQEKPVETPKKTRKPRTKKVKEVEVAEAKEIKEVEVVKDESKEVKVKTNLAVVNVDSNNILANIKTGGSLLQAGLDSGIIKDLLKGFLPIRYLKLEQKDPDLMGKYIYKLGEDYELFEGKLFPIFYHTWRQLSDNENGKFTTVCKSFDGVKGDTYGSCDNCPNADDCKKCCTVFFLSDDAEDDYIYTFTFREGFQTNGLKKLMMNGFKFYTPSYTKQNHKLFKFICI
jgi:hypothetical protein